MFEKLSEKLEQIRQEGIEWIKNEIKKRDISYINILPYISEMNVTNYLYYDCDKDGFGVATTIDALSVENDKIWLKRYNTYDCYFDTITINELNAVELSYLINMLEEIFELVDDGKPLLGEGEDFLDYE